MKIALQLLGLIIVSTTCTTQPPESLEALFGYYHERSVEKLGSPLSGAFIVMDSTSIIYKNTYGVIHPDSAKKIAPETRFYIGSLTKQFTAVLILQLVEENKIELHTPVSHYLEDYKNTFFDSITTHQLLSHTSGLPHYPILLKYGYTQEDFLRTPLTVDEYLKIISSLSLISEPEERFSYSSFGYIILGAIIEELAGTDFNTRLQEKIAIPLNLKNTGYNQEHLRVGYAEDFQVQSGGIFSGDTYTMFERRALSNAYSAGGMYSSVDDLTKWVLALKSSSLLKSETQKLMFEQVKGPATYGFFKNEEQFLRDDVEAQLISHGGEIMGYKSVIAIYDDGISVIALFNTAPLKQIIRFINQIHLAANNRSERNKPFIHPSLRNLTNFNREGGIEAFQNYHAKLSKRAGYEILPSSGTISHIVEMFLNEGQYEVLRPYMEQLLNNDIVYPENFLNSIGYAFLEYKKYYEAIRFFQKNIELYPESPNVYDSIGELYELKGDLIMARKYYSIALEKSTLNYPYANSDIYQKNLQRVTEE